MSLKKDDMIKKRTFIYLLSLCTAYLIGAFTIKYQLPPYQLVKKLRVSITPRDEVTKSLDREFIHEVSKFDELRYPPIQDKKQLHQRINNMLIGIDNFDSAYYMIDIISHTIENNKLILTYKYKSSIDTAFAYFKPSKIKNSKVGINLIPGSGINQSSAMFYQNDIISNYQSNIDDIAINYGDCFILVKPNEDFLAIHNGRKKIGEVSYVNHLLNNGGSYSAYYMIQGLALSKYLKKRYDEFYIFGLSQGGLAALINSIQSEPGLAVIASGFSVQMEYPYRSGHNQLIIPGYRLAYNPENIKSMISNLKTQFLFTWGLKEPGIYGIDAQEKLTPNFLKESANIKISIHPEAHIYHEPSITSFLESNKSTPHNNK